MQMLSLAAPWLANSTISKQHFPRGPKWFLGRSTPASTRLPILASLFSKSDLWSSCRKVLLRFWRWNLWRLAQRRTERREPGGQAPLVQPKLAAAVYYGVLCVFLWLQGQHNLLLAAHWRRCARPGAFLYTYMDLFSARAAEGWKRPKVCAHSGLPAGRRSFLSTSWKRGWLI